MIMLNEVKPKIRRATHRAGAVGWALLAWLLSGSLGIAILVFILLKIL